MKHSNDSIVPGGTSKDLVEGVAGLGSTNSCERGQHGDIDPVLGKPEALGAQSAGASSDIGTGSLECDLFHSIQNDMSNKSEAIYSSLIAASAAIGTAMQLATEEDLKKRPSHKISSRGLKRKSSRLNWGPIVSVMQDHEELAYAVAVKRATKTETLGLDYGPCYIKPRSVHWWDQYSNLVMTEDLDRFRKFFRVSVPTFEYICGLVASDLEKRPPPGLRTIVGRWMDIPKQVAIALRRLATGDSFMTVGEMFGVADSTCAKVCGRFVKALVQRAMPKHLHWPEGEELARVKVGFENFHGIPQCCGAIDCTHIPLELSKKMRMSDYYDRDHNCSMILQAIVDAEVRFTDVFVGLGSMHDAQVFSGSPHFHLVCSGQRLNGQVVEIEGMQVKEFIIGDAGYIGSAHMLVPWPGQNLPGIYDQFNYKLSSTKMVVERAFGILKGMWRILKTAMVNPDLGKVPNLISACCILHNIIIDRRQEIDESVVLWGHHDEGYRNEYSHTTTVDEAKQLQMVMAKHLSP